LNSELKAVLSCLPDYSQPSAIGVVIRHYDRGERFIRGRRHVSPDNESAGANSDSKLNAL
jgi:hypothetical protein